MKAALSRLLFAFVVLTLVAPALAVAPGDVLQLRIASLPNNRHAYYVKLLEASLKAAGYIPRIELVDGMAQPRIWQEMKTGDLTLAWGVQTTARDREYIGVDHRLTNGLIGQRVLMIPKGQEAAYAKVRDLADFKALNKVGGFGEGWFEVELWQLNNLPLVVRGGDWNVLFAQIAAGTRGVEYIARGVHEAIIDIKANPDLAIEPRLLLMHERDMRFYLSPSQVSLKPILEDALDRAERSGLKKRLVNEYLLSGLGELNLERRVRIRLETPRP